MAPRNHEAFGHHILRDRKNTSLRNESVNKEMTLLYDNNKDNVENIALFSRDGELLEAVPATRLKTG